MSEEYYSNSNCLKNNLEKKEETKEPEKRTEKLVNSQVVKRKKSFWEKIKDSFTGNGEKSIGDYILNDLFIPAAKDFICDTANDSINAIFRGGKRAPRDSYYDDRRRIRTSYDSIYSRSRYDDRRPERETSRLEYSFSNYVIRSREEAKEVLFKMEDTIRRYNCCTVGDFYDMIGVTPEFTDYKYGWITLRDATIIKVRDGYSIDLPKAMPIEK